MAPTHPELVGHAKRPLVFFVAGLVSGTLVYITSYLTQLSLHNENIGTEGYKDGGHKLWLWVSFALAIGSVVLFSIGAFASLGAMQQFRSMACPSIASKMVSCFAQYLRR